MPPLPEDDGVGNTGLPVKELEEVLVQTASSGVYSHSKEAL